MSSNDEVDGWIAQLMQCKPLSETEVKKLCDKVRHTFRGFWPLSAQSPLRVLLAASDSKTCSLPSKGTAMQMERPKLHWPIMRCV